MSYKIILDPGHGGSDSGATYNGRQEKDDALRLAMSVGQLIKNAGFDVEYTRTTDVYDTPFEKATMANEAGGDLFVSFHRNSSPMPNMYSGVQTLVFDDSGLKAQLAGNINENLKAIGFEDKGIVERPNLVVLKRTRMPAVLIEAGFVNSDRDNNFFDEHFDEVVQAIADAIIDTLDNWDVGDDENVAYYVQVGAFRNRRLADHLSVDLNKMGFDTNVLEEDGLYKVRVGMFDTLDEVATMEQRLRLLGYNTFIVTTFR